GEQRSRATPREASAEGESADGSCASDSSGSDRDDDAAAHAVSARDRTDLGAGRASGTASARCDGGDCATSSSVELDEVGEVRSEAEVDCGAGCTGSARSGSEAAHEAGAAARAPGSSTTADAACSVAGGDCRAGAESDADGSSDEIEADSAAAVEVDCGGAPCSGEGTTTTGGSATGRSDGASRASTGTASCEVSGGGCEASSRTGTDTSFTEGEAGIGPVGYAVLTDGDAAASSSVRASVDCGAGCTGSASGATTGKATAGGATRTTSASTGCTTAAGGCAAGATSQVRDRAAPADDTTADAFGHPRRELSASSTADAAADCDATTCTGSARVRTTGAATGDVAGMRDSTGEASCTVHGDGGCASSSATSVTDREPATGEAIPGVAPVSGPVSVSTAESWVECAGGAGTCDGTAESATSARDTAVSPHARGTKATAECTVTGGACAGTTTSSASSAPDFVAVDPVTGRPLPGQPTSGP